MKIVKITYDKDILNTKESMKLIDSISNTLVSLKDNSEYVIEVKSKEDKPKGSNMILRCEQIQN